MASPDPPWSGLPHDILSLVIDRLASSPAAAATGRRPFWSACYQLLRELLDEDRARFQAVYRSHHTETAVDRARFRAVCRSWRSAVREHVPRPPRRLPWTVLSDGSFMTGSDPNCHRLPSWPKDTTCIDSTDGWLALQRADSYLLHNPFSGTTVRLPEVDAVIGGSSSKLFNVRKVLMRSTPADVVVFMTNNYNYPIILARPGKGVWLPRPRSAPFIYIIDIAFVGDRLYGILEPTHLDKPNDLLSTTTTWHIIESLGKLLMVKRKLQWPSNDINYTGSADVFEANITTGAWIPLKVGLDGQALFISRYNCKSIHACGEVEKDAVYFVDTGDVLSMKSQVISQPKRNLHYRTSMWFFPPEIVV